MKKIKNLISLISLSLFLSCTSNNQIDLIVYNAKVYTVDSTFSVGEAFAVNNGLFIEIGTSDGLLAKYDAAEKIDAEGKPVYPGLYDAHGHLFLLAEALDEVNLVGSKSYQDVINRVKVYIANNPNKKWIIGNGWDQNLWEEKVFPTKDTLDKYFPDLPIYLTRIDYHAAVASSKAMEVAGLDSAYSVEGGLISIDENGDPDGILIDNAMQLVAQYIPKDQNSELLKILRRSQDSLFSVGLTSIVDAGLTSQQIESLKIFYNEDSLKIRDYAMVAASPESIKEYLKAGTFESERLTVRSFKLMADGALGSRGACLLHPYHDAPTNGFLMQSPEEFDTIIKKLATVTFK